MQIICAWCEIEKTPEGMSACVSHGICPACFAKVKAELETQRLKEAHDKKLKNYEANTERS